MKKSIVFALVLALLLAMAAPAFAFAIERSAQNLTVDGKAVVCDKYNIDGNNYFKLRDLAKLLNGTGSQFDVSWDADQQLVSITTKHPYTMPTGSELVVGEDKSATAVLSSQTIMIDGTVRRDLTVYNIGGSNFFKLRELGDALGFDVDYDPDSNTAIVASRGKPASASDLRLNDFCSITGKYAGDAGYYEYYSFSLPKITGADTACIRSVNAAVQDEFRLVNAYARPECRDCWAKLYCSGGCAANACHATGSIRGVYKLGCELFRKRIECAIMLKVAESLDSE